jgi:hypothetical protein
MFFALQQSLLFLLGKAIVEKPLLPNPEPLLLRRGIMNCRRDLLREIP